VSAKFELTDAQKADPDSDFPTVKMCEWAQVSTSGYYEWRDRPASATAIRREYLKKLVKTIFEHSDQTYGYRRVHAQLVRQGEQVSPELVRELMRELDLVACQPRPYRPTTTVPGDPGPVVMLPRFRSAGGGRRGNRRRRSRTASLGGGQRDYRPATAFGYPGLAPWVQRVLSLSLFISNSRCGQRRSGQVGSRRFRLRVRQECA